MGTTIIVIDLQTQLSCKRSKDFCAWKSLDVSKWIDFTLCIVLKIKHIIIANDHEFTSTALSPASNIKQHIAGPSCKYKDT